MDESEEEAYSQKIPNFKVLNRYVRPCNDYYDELRECTSMKGRFHQQFIYGEKLDCSGWEADFSNCGLWKKNRDEEAWKKLVNSEIKRKIKRLEYHEKNDVWERRKSPPPDWNKELPQYLQEEYKDSFLALKAKEIKTEGSTSGSVINERICVIM